MKNTIYNTGKDKWTHNEEIHNDWHVRLGPCPLCGTSTFNYGGGWRCEAMYCNNNTNNPAPNVGPEPSWWNKGINVKKDGNKWCAYHIEGFTNIQECNVGFGDTPNDAVKSLLTQ